ncbi:MAG: hypothetical protein QN168_02235 [Armatimonadota bacterium]|nr:hypothetical protein [Armatimonadota bacterium]
MVRGLMVWVLGILTAAAPLPPQGYAAAAATESNNQHKLVWAGGRLYVTYSKVASGISHVFVDVSTDGRTWRSLGQISRGEVPSTLSTLIVDPRGRVHVLWTRFDGGIGRVYHSRYDGRWSPQTPLSSAASYAGYPSLDVASGGRLHLVWYGIREASAGQPVSHGGIYEIYYLTSDGRWSPPERLSGGIPDALNAAIAVDGQDRPHVTWFQSDGQAFQVFYTVRDGTWTPPIPLTSGPQPSTKPAIAVDGGGRVHLVWERLERGQPAIYYLTGDRGRWSRPLRISERGGRHPTVGLWMRGVFALWQDEDGTVTLRAFDGRWRAPRRLGPGDYPNATPWKGSGPLVPFAVWTTRDGIRVVDLAALL